MLTVVDEDQMHPAARLQFERVVSEYSQWRGVPEDERSPAPAWWWAPAIQVVAQEEAMPAPLCYQLELPEGSTYAAGAAVLMAPILKQHHSRGRTNFPASSDRPTSPKAMTPSRYKGLEPKGLSHLIRP